MPNCLKIAEASVIIVFNGVRCEVRAYTVAIGLHEPGTRKALLGP